MKEEIDRWYKKLWETKGSRFVAANRLELHDKWSTIAVSISSFYIISLNLFVLFPEQNRPSLLCDINITYSTVCLSILILAVSLIVSSRNYKLRADKFHECGRRIDELYNKICIWKNTKVFPTNNEMEKISVEYSEILDRYENHIHLDYLFFQTNNLGDDKLKYPCWFWVKVRTQFYLQTIGFYIFIIFAPLIIIIIYKFII